MDIAVYHLGKPLVLLGRIMSRSFKHNPIIKDSSKFDKRKASKRVRKIDLSNGGNYKKVYDSWKISDYRFRYDPDSKYNINGILDFIRK